MITVVIDNYLAEKQCIELIEFYKANTKRVRQYMSYYPFVVDPNEIPYIERKLNHTAMDVNKTKLGYFGLVKWKVDTELGVHKDFHMEKDHGYRLGAVIYLNDEYRGGNTYYDDGMVITPKQGRALFFDSMYYRHGVSTVKEKERYTLTAWFK